MRRFARLIETLAVGALIGTGGAALAAEPVRIAFIDPLSGPFATTGESGPSVSAARRAPDFRSKTQP
jgi:hypothetical protein